MKYWNKPTTEQINKAIALLAHAEQRRYFFDKLNNPLWIAPLVGKGYFKVPPPVVHDYKKGTIGFPPWPESKFLIRMAEEGSAHKEIADIISKIKTDNVSVIGDLLDCLSKMPANLISPVVPTVKGWMANKVFWLLPEKYATFIIHLSEVGCVKEALALSKVLISVEPDPRYKDKIRKNKEYDFPPDAVSKFSDYDYEEVVQKITPSLARSARIEALKLFSDILIVTIRYSLINPKESNFEDYSYIWRPAIENHDQNHGEDIKNALVSAIRDTGQLIIKENSKEADEVVSFYSGKSWVIFHRLLLHCLCSFPTLFKKQIITELTSETNFVNPSIKHEYYNLIKGNFSNLPDEKQEKILSWIKKGPDIKEYKEYVMKVRGTAANDDEVNAYTGNWKLSKYFPIKDSLKGEDKNLCDSLITKFGEPDHPSFTSYSHGGVWVGPTSPKKSDELIKLTDKEIIGFLKDWEPIKDPQKPSREGLGREITSAIVTDPERFTSLVEKIVGTQPTYVRAVISGFKEVAKKNQKVPWLELFNLSGWVLQQDYKADEKNETWGEDIGWGWTRNAIVELLTVGFENNSYQIDFSNREKAWSILVALTTDPDPTPKRENERKEKSLDASSLSINSNRGEALHAVIKYALWVRRNLEKSKDKESLDKEGFSNMPEVKEVLENHLDIKKDPSVAIRSVYGQWFPWITLLDTSWASDNLDKIFPQQIALERLYWAAWEAYISFCDPYKNIFDVLSPQYEKAIRELPKAQNDKDKLHMDSRLVQHLAVYYWIGKIGLDEKSLLTLFFQVANDSYKSELIDFIGRSLSDTKSEIPQVVLDRLKVLWEWRVEQIKKIKPTGSKEITSFGWWFISERFDKDWSINQLLEVLRITHEISPDHRMIESLDKYALEFPVQVAECISLMVEGEKEGWGLLDWGKQLRGVLLKILSTKNQTANNYIEKLVDNLGKKGLLDYRDLVK